MLSKPLVRPSTTYITVPITTTMKITVERNTRIFRQLAASAAAITWYSPMKAVSLKMRNTRSSRRMRTSISACRPGASTASQVGSTASRSTTPKKLRA